MTDFPSARYDEWRTKEPDVMESLLQDPDKKCPSCGARGFMELYQVEPDEYAWMCECGGEIHETNPEQYIGYRRKTR